MTTDGLLEFMRTQRLAVQASVGESGEPQAALVGIAVSDSLEVIFDSVDTTRKVHNLRRNTKVAFVIGGWARGDERTVQYQGVADEPAGDELERIRTIYFAAWPDGPARLSWPGIVYIRVRPTWIRYTDFTSDPPDVIELTL
jgi:general stress protein 26